MTINDLPMTPNDLPMTTNDYIIFLFNRPEAFPPPDLTTKPAFILIKRKPDKYSFTYDMVVGDKSPETGIG